MKIITNLLLLTFSVSSFAQAQDSLRTQPIALSIIPPLATYALDGNKTQANLSLNLFLGNVAKINGSEFSAFANYNRIGVNGVQMAGFANVSTGNVSGIQGAGFLNLNSGTRKGVAFAGFANITGDNTQGAQFAGFANLNAGRVKGVQVAGFLNSADTVEGTQMSGFLNIAGKVDGLQLGIINLAGQMNGTAIGLISLAGNSKHRIQLFTTEIYQTGLLWQIKTGNTYNQLGISVFPQGEELNFAYGFGIGGNLIDIDFAALSLEVHTWQVLDQDFRFKDYNGLHQAKMLLHVGDTEFLSAHFGLVGNVFTPKSMEASNFASNGRYFRTWDNSNASAWVGLQAGLTFTIQ